MHDVAADQPEPALEPLGAEPRLGDDAGAKAGGVRLDRVEDRVGRHTLLRIPVAPVGQFGRELLAEQASDMAARGREAVVDGRGDQHLDDRRLRPAVALRIEEGAVHVIERWGQNNSRLVMLAGFGKTGEFRQSGQRDIHPEGAASYFERLDPPPEIGGKVGGVDQAVVEQLRSDIGDDAVGGDLLTPHQPHPDRPIPVDEHPRDRAFEADLDPRGAADLRHDLCDRAHAAYAVAPCPPPPVHFAEDMVEQDIGAAERVGRGIVADHRVEAEGRLHRLALEPAVEDGARRPREQVEHIALRFEVEAREAPPLPHAVEPRPHPFANIGWRV